MTKKSSKKRVDGSTLRLNRQQIITVIATLFIVSVGVAVMLLSGDEPAGSDGIPNTLSERPQLITPQNYVGQFVEGDADYVLIDVRTPAEFSGGHIVDSINIPVEELQSRIDEVPDGMPIVVYCRSGNRSAQAANILDSAGFNSIYDLGGVIDWSAAGYSLTN